VAPPAAECVLGLQERSRRPLAFHPMRILSLSQDLSLAVVIVETPERIEASPQFDKLVYEGPVILDDVEVNPQVGHQAVSQ
jgi:PII-like signaling protein